MPGSAYRHEVFDTTDPVLDHVEEQCLLMVEQGLLHLGFDGEELYFWPTFRGIVELDMLPTEGLPH